MIRTPIAAASLAVALVLAALPAPALAALAVIVYVRHEGSRPQEIALLEVASEGDATTILQTSDGPIVLLNEESGS